MIRANAFDAEGKPHILLGITPENIKRLMAGQPIRVTGESINVPSVGSVCVIFGETEAVIAEDFREAGLIGPHTITRDERGRDAETPTPAEEPRCWRCKARVGVVNDGTCRECVDCAGQTMARTRKLLNDLSDAAGEGLTATPRIMDRVEFLRECIKLHRQVAASPTSSATRTEDADFMQRLASIKRCTPHMVDNGGVWKRDVEWLVQELESRLGGPASASRPEFVVVGRPGEEAATRAIAEELNTPASRALVDAAVERLPTRAEQLAEYDRRKAEYDAAMIAWRDAGEVGPPPPRPVKPHTPGFFTPSDTSPRMT